MGEIPPFAALLVGLLLGAGLMTLAVVYVLGTLGRELSDEQLVALFRARARRAPEPARPVRVA
jgi:hypothetical protein